MRLRSGEFVHERSLYPIAEYSFKHPLTQAVAQESLLGEQRRELHAVLARAIEAAGGDLDEQAALLAHHWEQAGEAEPAAQWHRRAAEWIAGSNSVEADRHWRRVRELADQISDPTLAIELGGRSRVMILEYAWRRGVSQSEADELLREGEVWAQRHEDPRARARLYNAYATVLSVGLGQLARSREIGEEGWRLAQDAGDEPLSMSLELRLGLANAWAGDLRSARRWFELTNAHAPAVGAAASAMVGYDVSAVGIGYAGVVAMHEGCFEEAMRCFAQSLEQARARRAIEVQGWILGSESQLWIDRGDLSRAERLARESLEIAERIESPLSRSEATVSLFRVLAQKGDLDAAIALAAPWAEDPGNYMTRPFRMSALAGIRHARGEFSEARRLASEAQRLGETDESILGRVSPLVALARIQLSDAQPEAAATCIERAEQTVRAANYRLLLPEILELRAELAQQRGDAPGREQALREALQLYREMGAIGHAERIARETRAGVPETLHP